MSDVVPPPVFDIDVHQVRLPHVPEDIQHLLLPWAPTWLLASFPQVSLKLSTRQALGSMKHWSDLLGSACGPRPPEVHLYLDGSWHEKLQIGGYSVAIHLVTAGATALFGLLGERLQGNAATPWTFDSAPVLKTEQVALMAAMLWCIQSKTFLQPAGYHLYYDCAAAGRTATGEWDASNDFGQRVRAAAQFLRDDAAVPVAITHVKAHNDDPLNELVDTLAKATARGAVELPAPPRRVCDIVQQTDMSWLPLVLQNTAGCGISTRCWSSTPMVC